jgi:hypothetical protein
MDLNSLVFSEELLFVIIIVVIFVISYIVAKMFKIESLTVILVLFVFFTILLSFMDILSIQYSAIAYLSLGVLIYKECSNNQSGGSYEQN